MTDRSSPTGRVRAVLLDAGGTLIHPDHEFILAELAAVGVEADEAAYADALRHAHGVVAGILRSDDMGTDETRIRAWFIALLRHLGCPLLRMPRVGEAIRGRHEAGRLWVRALAGTREMLDDLRAAGLKLAVVSNADGRVASYLEAAGLADAFEFIIDSGVVGIEKPDPRIFHMACEKLGVAPSDAVYVGDTYEVDVLGARAAGMEAIYLTAESRDGATCIPGILDLPAALGLIPAADTGDDDDARA
jgi:HAD superfamily hydrolase (TIGR01509 family)